MLDDSTAPEPAISLEFQDSEVANITVDGTTVVVRFSAAHVHRHADGTDRDAGYLKSLELVCSGGAVLQQDQGCVGRISAGLLTVAGEPMKRVRIPFETIGDATLELAFTNGSRFHAKASGVVVRVAGGSRFLESFACCTVRRPAPP
ncbi:hypothetical protein BH11PSE9_BH11PSE9_13980 [soil metagenome]